MKAITNQVPVVAGTLTPLVAIHFSTAIETIFYAALGAITSIVIRSIYSYLKKKINEKFHKKLTE